MGARGRFICLEARLTCYSFDQLIIPAQCGFCKLSRRRFRPVRRRKSRWESGLYSIVAGPRSGDSSRGSASYHLSSAGLVQGASHGAAAVVQHVGVDHGRFDIRVAQELLHGSNIIAAIQQMRGERMPEGMTRGPLADARATHRLGVGAGDRRFVQVPADALARVGVDADCRGWKDELPAEFAAGRGRFPTECLRQGRCPVPTVQIAPMLFANSAHMLAQLGFDRLGKHGPPIFPALAMADDNDIVAGSRSLTRNRKHSSKRKPAPYWINAISRYTPSNWAMIRRTSS